MIRTMAGFVLALVVTGCVTGRPLTGESVAAATTLVAPAATKVLGQATVYRATDGAVLETVHDLRSGVAIVKLPDGNLTIIPAEVPGSEQRYRDDHLMLWENDGTALLWQDGRLLFRGREAAP